MDFFHFLVRDAFGRTVRFDIDYEDSSRITSPAIRRTQLFPRGPLTRNWRGVKAQRSALADGAPVLMERAPPHKGAAERKRG
jgi:hypothetical protein